MIQKRAFASYMTAAPAYEASKGHMHVGLNDRSRIATPGSTHLIPLAAKLSEKARSDMNGMTGGEDSLTLTASSSYGSFYEGQIENIIDGNAGTFAWYGGGCKAGDYYQVNLSKPSTVYGIHIQNGSTAEKPDDTFPYAKLTYTTDGTSWQDVNGTEYGEYATTVDVTVRLENVKAVRYECMRGNARWPSMREFTLDLGSVETPEVPEFTTEIIRTTDEEGWTVYNNGNERNMIDGNDATYVDYAVRWNPGVEGEGRMIPGDYVGVKLSRPVTLATIHVVGGGSASDDYIKNGTLQYSMNGTDWYDIQSYLNQSIINADVSARNIEAQYVRLVQNEI